jgi:uncharacterized protein (DUF2336 family)
MGDLDPQEFLTGMDEGARMQVAQRVGATMSEDDIPAADRRAAELLAYCLARDAIEQVRTALSVAIRDAKHLPRDLALMLAHDVDAVACPFLEVTDVFTDAEWQSLILTISRNAQIAVSRRETMTDGLALCLAEMGDSVVAETLIENPSAPMGGAVCDVLLDRFASEIWVIDKLADRDDLLGDIVVKLVTRVSAAAREKLAATYDLDDLTAPVSAEAETAAVFESVKSLSEKDMVAAAETLHGDKRLTPSLLLAAARDGQAAFFEVGISVVSGRSLTHVRSVLERADEKTVRGLFEKTGMPGYLMEEFWAEVEAMRRDMKT